MRRAAIACLVVVAIVCIAVALYYPISYYTQLNRIEQETEQLKALKPESTSEESPAHADLTTRTPTPSPVPQSSDGRPPDEGEASAVDQTPLQTADSEISATLTGTPAVATPTPEPTATLEPVILEECKPLLELNPDYVGWLTIEGTEIDYPVLQTEDEEYYLTHDFYGEENVNGQLILDAGCDIKQPSYNLVISGHNMKSGKMFADLKRYSSQSYWKRHKTLQFNSLYRHGEYVIFAAFYSKDYDVDEEGFRYNADIRFGFEMTAYLDDIDEVKAYETGVDVRFGDELITLSTCSSHTDECRFVVVARKIREGEEY